MEIASYLNEVRRIYKTGEATEHSYRPVLERLFNSVAEDVTALNEPRAVKVGRPDFVFQRGLITVGHCEAKDIGLDIDPRAMKDANKEQFERYRKALPNLLYTNGIDFRFYNHGDLAREVSIADLLMGIRAKPDQFAALSHQLRDFCAERLQTITSAEQLAKMMAGKAVLIKDILFNSLKEDKDLLTELTGQLNAFRKQLIHDLSVEDFADLYAETIAYGLFGARLHDTTIKDFSREEALELLPKSNPFLRNLFGYVAGPQLDERIRRTIDELAEIFQATDLSKLFEDFGKFTQRNDPFIHFYETFLAEYNPAKRRARGVWYTPEPVVSFIVRAVDDVLKTEFGLADGLADTSKITVDWDTGQKDKKGKPLIIKKDVHRVQILDPAAGTGTFLAEVIKQIAPRIKTVASGQWSSYVEKELIPRLHGFELLMASYAMCHMKLDMMLTELGYKPTGTNSPRLSVYLTNSLEEGEKVNQSLPFAQWLSNEAKEASTVKCDMPIMVVIGNPPYNNSSTNKGDWILSQIKMYKKGLGEQKINLDDDYIKFIRLAELFVEKNDYGVIGLITNNSFLDGATHRLMRRHMLETFQRIYVLNLYGDIRGGAAEDNDRDQNVFDITQGVCISICVRKRRADSEPSIVQYVGKVGLRADKYQFLWQSSLTSIGFETLAVEDPNYYFVPKSIDRTSPYFHGFRIADIFTSYSSGVQTKRDKLCVKYEAADLSAVLVDFMRVDDETFLRRKYALPADGRDWTIARAKADVAKKDGRIVPFLYRPFDIRHIYYSGRTKGFVAYPRREIMQHMVEQQNIALIANRQTTKPDFSFVNVTSLINCHGTFYLGNRGQDYIFPLYLHPDSNLLARSVNFNPKISMAITDAAEDGSYGRPDEVAIFDYIYGVLHCPAYRQTYREFLKIDFPRIPYPPTPEVFWDVSTKGTELRRLHLMEDAAIGTTPFPFTGEGNSIVRNVAFKPFSDTAGAVYINSTQCFENVPELSWEFYIGGYQPAQKWLKDRKGRVLSFDDIRHYQKIVKILSETDRIMKTITMPLGAE